jgi:nitrite reductase/ring-hydroxylating ferredoxin subunit
VPLPVGFDLLDDQRDVIQAVRYGLAQAMQVELTDLPELELGRPIAVVVNDRELLLVRTKSGTYALDDHCPHLSLPLSDGSKVRDDCLICRHHGVQIDVTDGSIVSSMGHLSLPSVQTFAVTSDQDQIFVDVPPPRRKP